MKYIVALLFILCLVSCNPGDQFCDAHIEINNRSSFDIEVCFPELSDMDTLMQGEIDGFWFGDCSHPAAFSLCDLHTHDTLLVYDGFDIYNDSLSTLDDLCIGDIVCIEFIGYEAYTDGTHSGHNYSLVITDSVFGRWCGKNLQTE